MAAEEMTPRQFWRTLYPHLVEAGLPDTWTDVFDRMERERKKRKQDLDLLEKKFLPSADNLRRHFWEAAACAALTGFLSNDDYDGAIAGAAAYADKFVEEWAERFEKVTHGETT